MKYPGSDMFAFPDNIHVTITNGGSDITLDLEKNVLLSNNVGIRGKDGKRIDNYFKVESYKHICCQKLVNRNEKQE